ncbi:hypothetical protein U1Q18_031173 [Sarracenia purpurea var. burkii]
MRIVWKGGTGTFPKLLGIGYSYIKQKEGCEGGGVREGEREAGYLPPTLLPSTSASTIALPCAISFFLCLVIGKDDRTLTLDHYSRHWTR